MHSLGAHSLTWKLNSENAILLGAGRALILQVAHPQVAAGVEDHSDYADDPWKRLERTLDITGRIIYSDEEDIEKASKALYNRHKKVTGKTPQGKPYQALDPQLLFWVFATLIDTTVLVHQEFIKPLTNYQLDKYWYESQELGEAFSIPSKLYPQNFKGFQDYFQDQITKLAWSKTLQAVTESIFSPVRHPGFPDFLDPLWKLMMLPIGNTLKLQTAALLPPRLLKLTGISYPGSKELLYKLHRLQIHQSLKVLPNSIRYSPYARKASKRTGTPLPFPGC